MRPPFFLGRGATGFRQKGSLLQAANGFVYIDDMANDLLNAGRGSGGADGLLYGGAALFGIQILSVVVAGLYAAAAFVVVSLFFILFAAC